MGAKGKISLKKRNLKKVTASVRSAAVRAEEPNDFLPLEGLKRKKFVEKGQEEEKSFSTVLYIGHIPHGFYEEQMEGFFKQFGTIKHLRIARNKKTGNSKHYGFLEYENPEVAKVVAEEMNNYLLFEHNLQVHLVPPERVHPKLWRGTDKPFIPKNWVEIARKQQNKRRTAEEQQRLVKGIFRRDKKRRERIKAAGIDYECPEIVGRVQRAKRIKFAED